MHASEMSLCVRVYDVEFGILPANCNNTFLVAFQYATTDGAIVASGVCFQLEWLS